MKTHQIPATEWLAVYYDNPEVVPAEKLRCDTVIGVAEDFTVPENSEGVMVTHIEGGEYAVARARIVDNNFVEAWERFFEAAGGDENYRLTGKPCFEYYLNDGSESGVWEIDMYSQVIRRR